MGAAGVSGVGYSKFFWSDWRSDPKLRMCSLAARGLWIDMLSLMAEAVPKGELRIGDVPITTAQLALFIGSPFEEVERAFSELEKVGVFSRNRNDIPYSRRMVRDEKKRVISEKNGRKGGNPTLSREKGNSSWDNQKANPHGTSSTSSRRKTPSKGFFSAASAPPKPNPEDEERRRLKVEEAKKRIFDA